MHAIRLVIERVFELVRRVRGDFVYFRGIETNHGRAGIHADPDVAFGVLDEDGHEIGDRRVLVCDGSEPAVLETADAGRRTEPDSATPVLGDREHDSTRESFAGPEETTLSRLVHRGTSRQQTEPHATLAVGEDRLTGLVREVRLFVESRDVLAVPRHHALQRRAQPQRILRVGGEGHYAARTNHLRDGLVLEGVPDQLADLLAARDPQSAAPIGVQRHRLRDVVRRAGPTEKSIEGVTRGHPHAAVAADGGRSHAVVGETLQLTDTRERSL